MSAFELVFSLFGLILGLAVAVVIGGLSDLLRERRRIPIGHLTPMLALFVLFDLSSLWVNTYDGMSDIQVAYGPFVAALVVAGAYFFAAGMIFPKTLSEWASLDDYYAGHHRWVFGGVIAANLGLLAIEAMAQRSLEPFLTMLNHPLPAVWWVTLVVLAVIPHRRVQQVGLSILLLIAMIVLVIAWGPQG